jgi:hypothetical protein
MPVPEKASISSLLQPSIETHIKRDTLKIGAPRCILSLVLVPLVLVEALYELKAHQLPALWRSVPAVHNLFMTRSRSCQGLVSIWDPPPSVF